MRSIYLSQCGVCHGEKMEGSPPAIPSLVGVVDRHTPAEVTATIKNGKGRMQGFPNLTGEQVFALVNYLSTGESKELNSSGPLPVSMKYRFTGYHKFLDPEGYPAIAPPWGTLTCDRSKYRRVGMEDSAGRVLGTGGEGGGHDRE